MKVQLMALSKMSVVAVAVALTACGGGGGGGSGSVTSTATLSGTVAGGAAVIGNVLVTDSKGVTKGAVVDSSGHYSLDVSDMTGPFILKAAGTVGNTSVTYYSAATDADKNGTVNVTPFTNMMVSNIAAQLAENFFKDPANVAKIGTLITSASLAKAEADLHAKLLPVLNAMGVDSSIDLLRTSFAADHTKIDAVLDLVKVETDPTTNVMTLKNAMTQAVIATDDATTAADDKTPVDSTLITDLTPATVTDLQTVIATLNSFAALFANGLPSVATIQNSGVFDTSSNFMMGGQSFLEFATQLSTQQSAIGLKFSNVAIALDAGGTTGTLTAQITSNTAGFSDQLALKVVKVGSAWQVVGDGKIADLSLRARAQYNQWTTYSASFPNGQTGSFFQNGIWVYVDPYSYNAAHASAMAVSAVVTGPGLSAGGVTMVQDTQNTWFKLSNSQYSDNLIPECSGSLTSQCVVIAQAVDNSEYTIVLKDSQGNSLNGAGYKMILAKQPYATSALAAPMFPAFGDITIDGNPITLNTVVANKSVNVTWTMPTGLTAKYANIWANTTTGASYVYVGKELAPAATSALFGLGTPLTTGTVSNAGVWLEARDGYGRSMAINKSLSVQ